jgi:hypothetical protein
VKEVAVFRTEIEADYHQFYLGPVNSSPAPDPQHKLLTYSPGGPCADEGRTLIVSTGCRMGPVLVTVRSLDGTPAPLADSMAGWDIGVEDTVLIIDDIAVGSWAPEDPTYQAFTPTEPGPHRVRVQARGRAEHYDAVAWEATEEYDISIWPTDSTEPRLSLGDDGVT